jgi:hypothetical protein
MKPRLRVRATAVCPEGYFIVGMDCGLSHDNKCTAADELHVYYDEHGTIDYLKQGAVCRAKNVETPFDDLHLCSCAFCSRDPPQGETRYESDGTVRQADFQSNDKPSAE